MKQAQVRQGDVFVRPCKDAVRSGKPVSDRGRVILAYGEVTGHAHEVIAGRLATGVLDEDGREAFISDTDPTPACALFEQPDGRRFLFVDRPCMLRHEEHGAIALAPGSYEVIRQREYSPEAIRNVAD